MAHLPPAIVDQGRLPMLAAVQGIPPAPAAQGLAPHGIAAQAAAVQGIENCKTFSELFSNEERDPYSRQYARIMNRFATDQPNAVAAEELLRQVVDLGGNQLHAYLCCGDTNGFNGPRIYCLHFPTRFLSALDGQRSMWDQANFAFLGEAVGSQVTTVVFPVDAFNMVTTRVKTQDYILQHLDTLTEIDPLFPPELPGSVHAEEVTTRTLSYLPAVYVPLLLSAGGYTPKQVWERLYPALQQRQDMDTCAPLLKWLQVASTSTVVGNSSISTPLIAPPADEVLLAQRLRLLHQLLPGLTAPPASLEQALSQMATAIVHQTNDNRQAREQKTAADLEPKLPSDKFSVTLPVLLEFLQLADERELPPLWHKWANGKKREEFQILREALEAFARSPSALSPAVPVVSAKLVQDLLNFNFIGDSTEDIKTGFHPFIIADGNAEQRLANLEVARLYGYLQTGDMAVSLKDLEALQAKEVRSVPVTYWELEKTISAFGNLMGVVLGLAHPLLIAYRDMWAIMNSSMRDELQSAIDYQAHVKPTHLLRSIQLVCHHWFSSKRARLTPPTPDFAGFLHQIHLQVYILPRLPTSLYQLAYPRSTKSQHGSTLPGLITTGSASGGSSGMSAVSGLASTTPSLRPQGTTTSGANTAAGRGAFMSNLAPLVSLITLDKPNVKLRDIISNTAPPKMDDNTEVCLSYHLRGGCWSNCKRAANHGRLLSPTETQRIELYLSQRLAALQPAQQQTTGASVTTGVPP